MLKEFLRLDYRKLSALLEDAPSLAAAIGLKSVPHFSAFPKSGRSLVVGTTRAAAVRRNGGGRPACGRAPEEGRASRGRRHRLRNSAHQHEYFVKRREKGCQTGYLTTTYTQFLPYANMVCPCRSHFVLAIVTGRGPGPDDPYYEPALRQAVSRIRVATLLADAGFDSERAQRVARQACGIRAIIPATRGQPTKRLRGYWRNKMKQRFPPNVSTVSDGKSKQCTVSSSACSAPHCEPAATWSQSREIILKALTLNVMILRCREVFENQSFRVGWQGARPPLRPTGRRPLTPESSGDKRGHSHRRTFCRHIPSR